MPNWCDNRLRISGPTKAIDEFIAGANKKVKESEDGMCILPNYLPFPPGLEGEPVETDNGSFVPFTDRGYTWCLMNWGCKWADSGTRVISKATNHNGEYSTITIYMNTPWGPPSEGIQRISAMFPELVFTLAFHEDGMSFSGVVQYSGGEMLSDIDGDSPPEYVEDDEDKWVNDIEEMYENLFAAAYNGGK